MNVLFVSVNVSVGRQRFGGEEGGVRNKQQQLNLKPEESLAWQSSDHTDCHVRFSQEEVLNF